MSNALPLLTRLPSAPKRVVILRASRIGDFICATPAFRALRRALPAAEITLIAMPFVEELVQRFNSLKLDARPYLDRFFAFPGYPGIAEQFFQARPCLQFLQQQQQEEYDLAIQLHGSGVYSNPFTLMLGAKSTVGYVRPGDAAGCLEVALPFPEHLHAVKQPLALITLLGADAQGDQTEFPLWEADHRVANKLLSHLPRPLIGLHPAAADGYKCWPADRFAAVGQLLQQTCGGTILILGNQASWPLAQAIAHQIGPVAVNLAGQTTLASLGATIAQLSIFITNDSGPAHIAYALHTPSVTVFGQTDPMIWGPLPTNPSFPCHRVISINIASQVSNVFTSIDKILVATVHQEAMQAMESSAGLRRWINR